MKIIFVRHTSVTVPPGVCYGQTDVPLKPSFPEEAATVKENLERKYGNFTNVYCSPLSRAVRLSEYCGYPDAIRDSRLLEMDFGEWEMMKYDEIKDPRLSQWYEDWENIRATAGESFKDQTIRVKDFIKNMKSSGKDNILVFTHAGVIMNALYASGKATKENLFSHQPPYGGIIELEF